MTEQIFPKLENLDLNIPRDFLVIIFTLISLSLAELTYQSESPIDIDQLAKFMVNIMIHGPAKTMGILPQKQDSSLLF